jgi:hypothetical protein
MDEAFVPYTRQDYNLPSKEESTMDIYREALEDSPIYSLGRLLVMNFFGHRKWYYSLILIQKLTNDIDIYLMYGILIHTDVVRMLM